MRSFATTLNAPSLHRGTCWIPYCWPILVYTSTSVFRPTSSSSNGCTTSGVVLTGRKALLLFLSFNKNEAGFNNDGVSEDLSDWIIFFSNIVVAIEG